jgi:hypothetical protein
MISITVKLQTELFLVLSMSFILRNILMKYGRFTLKQLVHAKKKKKKKLPFISYHHRLEI